MKNMVIDCFFVTLYAIFQIEFCSTPLEREAQNGSFKWLNHPKLPKITELQGAQISTTTSTDLKICCINLVFAK